MNTRNRWHNRLYSSQSSCKNIVHVRRRYCELHNSVQVAEKVFFSHIKQNFMDTKLPCVSFISFFPVFAIFDMDFEFKIMI